MFADPELFFEDEPQVKEETGSNDSNEPNDYEAELKKWENAPALIRQLAERSGYLNSLRAAAGYQPINSFEE